MTISAVYTQLKPAAAGTEQLDAVATGHMYNVNLFVVNTHASASEKIRIFVNGSTEANALFYDKPIEAGETISITGLMLPAGTTIIIYSQSGYSNFIVTGIDTTL